FRGMYGAENLRALLMVDGIVENNILGTNDMAGPAYSLQNVERIEIIWGPASALYGANAFGGVINIITKKGAELNGIHAETGFGSFNTSIVRASLGLRKNNFDIAISGSMYSSDGPRFTNRDPEYSASYVDKAYSFNTTISYFTSKTKTSIGYRNYRTPIGWGTYANSPTQYLHLPPQGNSNLGVIGIMQRDFHGERSGLVETYLGTFFLQHDLKLNDKWNFMGRAVYRETGDAQSSFLYLTIDGTKMYRVKYASWSNRISGELSANYSPSQKHRFSFGAQFNQDNVEAGSRAATFDSTVHLVDGKDTLINLGAVFLPRQFDVRNNFGSYLQYVLHTKLFRETEFTAGIRYDHNSYFGDAVSPRLVIVNHPTDKLTFKLQYGKAFRAPTNSEIHQAPLNFELTTEKIITYEANLIYVFGKQLRVQLNGFRNEMKDIIVLGNLSGFNPDKNPGVINVNGLEGIVNFAITKNSYGYFNFSWQDARGENLTTGIKGDVPAVAKFKANIGATANVSGLFTASLTGNYVGKRGTQRTNPYGPVKGYFLTNFIFNTKPLFSNRITASVIVHNLFNSTWLDPGFRTADGALYSTVLEQPGTSLLFKLSLHLNNN
ncbi:MAG TPA: TonB-dependent receptor, partial [Ferruginibacter sp.]|nr:TonB-dependent receptor [Ferruginibacter sp.]